MSIARETPPLTESFDPQRDVAERVISRMFILHLTESSVELLF